MAWIKKKKEDLPDDPNWDSKYKSASIGELLDNIASTLEEKGHLEAAERLDVISNTLEASEDGSYIIISAPVLDYDLLYKEAGKGKKKRIKRWIPNMQEGGLHKDLGVKQGEDIPKELMDKKYSELKEKSKGDKTLSDSDSKLFKRLQFAINARGFKKSKKGKK